MRFLVTQKLLNISSRLPFAKIHILAPVIIVISSCMFYLINLELDLFDYHPHSIDNVELWRLITANFLHTNWQHLALNVGGIILLWALHGEYYTVRNYLFVFFVCGLATTLGLYWFTPDMTRYVGLSGALHGLFVWGALHDIQRKMHTGWILLIGVWLKILHEQWFGAGAEIENLINASVAIDAHLYGAIAGMCWLPLAFKRCAATQTSG